MPPLGLNEIVGIGTLVAIMTGLVFGIVQIRQQRQKRQDAAAFDFLSSLQREEIFVAARAIGDLPADTTAADIRRGGPEMARHATVLQMWCEAMGYAVYSRLVPLRMVDDMAGGSIRACWVRLRAWAEDVRAREGNPNPYEWFQWLAERLEQYPSPGKAKGAHISYMDWRPR